MLIPARIGRYEVLGLLGTGGMAEVFLGRIVGPSGFKRPVVIKRTLPHLARERSFVDMFLDEARIVAGIRHPNVVQVHELCQDGDDLFLVMEYLEGESLAGLMRRLSTKKRLLSFDLCAHVIAEVCTGLHAAHELTDESGKKLDLVHRDVSPANVFVTYEGNVKILDFGIATASDRLASKTQAGQVKGKYPYMSPEQCRGLPLDRRSDLFSLGIVLFELSTCRRLFHRANEMQTVDAICGMDVPPPSEYVPGYPPALDQICLRALTRDPNARYQSAPEMRKDLVAVAREQNPSGDIEDTLRRVMHKLFADRIEEKRLMLGKIASGRSVTRVPKAELDEVDEISSDRSKAPLRFASTRASSDEIAVSRLSHRRTPNALLILGAFVAASAVIGGTAALTTNSGRTPEPSGIAVQAEPAVPEAESPRAPQPEPPRSIGLSIITEPPGAKVYVREDYRGDAPIDVTLERSDAPIHVRVEHGGYRKLEETIVPDRDQRLHLSMTAIARPLRPAPKNIVKAEKKKPPPEENRYRRFD